MKLTDTHCHIVGERYENQTKEDLINEWKENNGGLMFVVGTDAESSEEMLEVSKKYDFVQAIVGIHPEYAHKTTDDDIERIEKLIPQSCAVGEIGLDFHYGKEHEEKQIEIFEKQMQLAEKYSKPVCIHTREAFKKTFDILKKYPTVKGVVHCFSGSKESAIELVKIGYLIGVGGILTFKNGRELRECVESVGIENIVLETDAPYLTPEPFRGQVNKPHYVEYVAKKVAEILDLDLDEVLKITEQNAKKIYNLEF